MRKLLKEDFFNRDVAEVARELIGKFLIRNMSGEQKAYMITETEAYDGESDLACHASKGRTKRSEVLYWQAGHLYVYLCYGMYDMLNVVAREKDYPAAVLIRGLDGINGPGRITKNLRIDRSYNGKKLSRRNGLWFEDRGVEILKKEIFRTPRVGVEYAGPIWSKKLYRFIKR